MDSFHQKTKSMRENVIEKLNEMDKIFNITKNFSKHFDVHALKLQQLIYSLLDTDYDEDNDILNQLEFNHFEYQQQDKHVDRSHQQIHTNNHQNILDEHYQRMNQSMPAQDLNNQQNFIELFKKQNSNLNKMLEVGEENSKTLRAMFDKLFETFVQNHQQNDQSKLKEEFQSANQKLKDQIQKLELQNQNLKFALENKPKQDKNSLEQISQLTQQNSTLKQSLKDLNQKLNNSLQENQKIQNELQITLEKANSLQQQFKDQQNEFKDLENSVQKLLLEEDMKRKYLQSQIFDLDFNNTQTSLFNNSLTMSYHPQVKESIQSPRKNHTNNPPLNIPSLHSFGDLKIINDHKTNLQESPKKKTLQLIQKNKLKHQSNNPPISISSDSSSDSSFSAGASSYFASSY